MIPIHLYCALRASPVTPPVVPLPSLATLSVLACGLVGGVVGVAYRMLTVHVPAGANGVVNEHVVPVML